MSLFPFTDLIPQICRTLSYTDILALLAVNHETNKQLSALIIIENGKGTKHECTFDITEISIVDVIMRTTVKISVHCEGETINVRDLHYAGSTFTGLIWIDEPQPQCPRLKIVNIINVKNNIAEIGIAVLLRDEKIRTVDICKFPSADYVDFIAKMINYFIDPYDTLAAVCKSFNPHLRDVLRRRLESDKTNDAELISAFEQIQ